MSLKTESNLRISGTEDLYTEGTMSAANANNIEDPPFVPNTEIELDPLSDTRAQEGCNQISLQNFPKLKTESASIDDSRILGKVLVSEQLACIDSKDHLSALKEEPIDDISSRYSTVPVSYEIGIKRLNPVVVLERFDIPTGIASSSASSIQRVEGAKNEEIKDHSQNLHIIRYGS